jgi:hypothetical protein
MYQQQSPRYFSLVSFYHDHRTHHSNRPTAFLYRMMLFQNSGYSIIKLESKIP